MIPKPVNCLEIDIPDAVMTECSRIENGQGMRLHGICVKKGSANTMKKSETVTIFAARNSTSVVFSLQSASMGHIFQKKLSGIWSCQVHTTSAIPRSPNPERNEGKEDFTVDSVPAAEISDLSTINPDLVKQEFDEAVEEHIDDQCLSTSFVPSQEKVVPPQGMVSMVKKENSNTEFCELPGTVDNPDGNDLDDDGSSNTLKLPSIESNNKNDNVGRENSNHCEKTNRRRPSKKSNRRDIKNKPHACTKCNKTFITKYLLDRHEAVHDPDKGMQCPFCQRQYKLKYQLDSHVKTHTGEPSTLSCNICDKNFKRKISLEVHVRQHTGENPYTCETCGKGFRTRAGLAKHRYRHTGEYPHKCETCNKGFPYKSSLNTHKRLHTGEKPFVCTICGKTFRDHSGFFVHHRAHTNEKPYRCSVCGKTYKCISRLNDHSTLHNAEKSFFCEICGMGFWKKSNLANHKRIHSGKKDHKCSTCGREFRLKEHLKVHIRQHTGEKPYTCELCGESFRQNALIIRHRRLQHSTAS